MRVSDSEILGKLFLGSAREICFLSDAPAGNYKQAMWWSKPRAWCKKAYASVHICWNTENQATALGFNLLSVQCVPWNLARLCHRGVAVKKQDDLCEEVLEIETFYANVFYFCGIVIINLQSWRKSLIKLIHIWITAEHLQMSYLERKAFVQC